MCSSISHVMRVCVCECLCVCVYVRVCVCQTLITTRCAGVFTPQARVDVATRICSDTHTHTHARTQPHTIIHMSSCASWLSSGARNQRRQTSSKAQDRSLIIVNVLGQPKRAALLTFFDSPNTPCSHSKVHVHCHTYTHTHVPVSSSPQTVSQPMTCLCR